MATPWILAVDLGTGGPKTGAITLDGELLAVAHRAVGTTYTDDGGAVQDPAAWWEGIRGGIAEVLGHGVAGGDAVGVGITGQWGSTVPVGANDEAIGPCLLWSDTRGRALASERVTLSSRSTAGIRRMSARRPSVFDVPATEPRRRSR